MNFKPLTSLLFTFLVLACHERKAKSNVLNIDTNLKKTDRGWLHKGRPFSGYMLEKEENRVVYQLPIFEGLEQGLAKGWYNSGEKLLERIFINGKKEGKFQQWWPNGKLRYLFNYKNDQFDGKQLVYFPNGKIREESNYHLGEKEGTQRVWNENCKLISNYVIKNKRIYGLVSVKSCIPIDGH